jgi:hypothetical protein
MPIHRAGMLKTPVDGNPPRPPGLQPNLFWARGVPADVQDVKVLPRKNVRVAFEKGAPQMVWQRFERAAILRVVGVNRIVVEPGANEIVIARVVKIRKRALAAFHVVPCFQRTYPWLSRRKKLSRT